MIIGDDGCEGRLVLDKNGRPEFVPDVRVFGELMRLEDLRLDVGLEVADAIRLTEALVLAEVPRLDDLDLVDVLIELVDKLVLEV